MTAAGNNVTQILHNLSRGDQSAVEALLSVVYDELHRLAHAYMKQQRPDHTLQPTALVHEAFLRLVDQTRTDWKDRAHFMAVAATAMRQILINHAKRRDAAKRGGEWQRITLDDAVTPPGKPQINLLALDEALSRLGELNARQCRIVELRFFAGLTIVDTAEVLGVGTTTVDDDWRLARAWLARELKGSSTP